MTISVWSQQQTEDEYQEFKAAIEALRTCAVELGRLYIETPQDPLRHYALVTREIEVGGQINLVQRRGKKGWWIAKPNETAEITLTIKAVYNVTTGEVQVTDLKLRLAGQ